MKSRSVCLLHSPQERQRLNYRSNAQSGLGQSASTPKNAWSLTHTSSFSIVHSNGSGGSGSGSSSSSRFSSSRNKSSGSSGLWSFSSKKPVRRFSPSSGTYLAACPSISLGKRINCFCEGKTRHGLCKISSVGSGSGSFFSSPSTALSLSMSTSLSFPSASFFSSPSFFSSAFLFITSWSSTSIMLLSRSLGAIESAVEPTMVVPGVAATDALKPCVEATSTAELATDALSSASTSMAALLLLFFTASSFSFLSLFCLALAAVDNTAAAAFVNSSFFGGFIGSGYAKSEGFPWDFKEKFLGIFNLSVRPMSAVGVKVRENMWIKGNQYHICEKR